ncbi:MAG TPA: ABC transporter permease [Puia sp.]|nr:ABC transporter permease [Puia sp.]
MIRNYFKTAWRNLIRNRAFSLINISGLAIGLACSLLIMLWIQDEKSIDAFHKNGKYLYAIYERNYFDGKVDASYPTQGLLGDELQRVIPEIKYATGLESASAPGTMNTFQRDDKIIKMGGCYAGESFFNMFSFPLLQGNVSSALTGPGVIAISKKMAAYFFGTPQKAIGQGIHIDNKDELKVTAVFEDIPANSSLKFDFLLSWTDFVKDNDWVHNWGNTDPNTYIQLQPNADPSKVASSIKDFIYRYQRKNKSFITEIAMQPFPEKYLHSSFKNGNLSGGRIEYVRLFTVVVISLLSIACINFMNLATAQSARRAKEVGLRKVVGALRSALVRQFIGEAMLLTLFAVIIALIIVSLLLPAFNQLTGKQLSVPMGNPAFWLMIVALLIATGLIAGSYPAFFLSSLDPIKVLKGSLKTSWSDIFVRKGLVVFQFSLSIILMVSMIVIYRQMNYIETTNIGYDRENLLYIPIEGDLVQKYAFFKNEAYRVPGILDVSKMRNSPTVIQHHTGSISWPGKDPNLAVSFADAVVGYDFVKTMKLHLEQGRDFSKDFASDSASFLINETAADKLGFLHPLGQAMTWGGHPGHVIGVLKDFHFNSMHQNIEPLIVRLDENWNWGTILARMQAGKTKEALTGLEKICKNLNPNFPFSYQFSDLEFSKLYKSEQIVSKLSDYFAFIAILISCLGLFALAAFTAAQRTKEIGVRKVLGASIPNIIAMLSNNFLKLVVVSMVIAFPLAWWAMNKWLENFAYRININSWVFVLAGLATILIALVTVGYQSIRAAVANPVRSLRAE